MSPSPSDATRRGDFDRQPPEGFEPVSPEARQELLLDEAIEETFPASDPISPMLIS